MSGLEYIFRGMALDSVQIARDSWIVLDRWIAHPHPQLLHPPTPDTYPRSSRSSSVLRAASCKLHYPHTCRACCMTHAAGQLLPNHLPGLPTLHQSMLTASMLCSPRLLGPCRLRGAHASLIETIEAKGLGVQMVGPTTQPGDLDDFRWCRQR